MLMGLTLCTTTKMQFGFYKIKGWIISIVVVLKICLNKLILNE
jgi:hypothetical protein